MALVGFPAYRSEVGMFFRNLPVAALMAALKTVTVYFISAIKNNEMIIFYINSVMFLRPERAI
jgi:hypothetical protein